MTAKVENEAPRLSRILIVEDNPDTARTLALLLEVSGFEVAVARDGGAALRAAAEERPDVVLLDLGLPVMNGYEVGKKIREELGLRDSLLVAISGYGDEEAMRQSARAGFDEHLVKPVDNLGLLELIRRFRRRPRRAESES